jgi:hypothetical protein
VVVGAIGAGGSCWRLELGEGGGVGLLGLVL